MYIKYLRNPIWTFFHKGKKIKQASFHSKKILFQTTEWREWSHARNTRNEIKNKCVCVCVSVSVCVCILSRVRLFLTAWAEAHKASLSMGFFQAKTLEWIAISFSSESSQPQDKTSISHVSSIVGRLFTTEL